MQLCNHISVEAEQCCGRIEIGLLHWAWEKGLVEDADAGVGEGVGDPWRGGESDAIVSLTAHHPLLLLQPHPARTAMPSSYHCCSYRTILHCSYMPPLLGKKLTVIHIFTSSQALIIGIFFAAVVIAI